MRKWTAVMLFLASIIVSSILFSILIPQTPTIQAKGWKGELKIDFKVGQGIGFVVDNDALHFGKLPTNGYGGENVAKRYFSVTNKNDAPVEVNFTVSETIRNWVFISENPVLLAPKENKQLKAELKLPQNHNLPEGKYNGTLYVIFTEVG